MWQGPEILSKRESWWVSRRPRYDGCLYPKNQGRRSKLEMLNCLVWGQDLNLCLSHCWPPGRSTAPCCFTQSCSVDETYQTQGLAPAATLNCVPRGWVQNSGAHSPSAQKAESLTSENDPSGAQTPCSPLGILEKLFLKRSTHCVFRPGWWAIKGASTLLLYLNSMTTH